MEEGHSFVHFTYHFHFRHGADADDKHRNAHFDRNAWVLNSSERGKEERRKFDGTSQESYAREQFEFSCFSNGLQVRRTPSA